MPVQILPYDEDGQSNLDLSDVLRGQSRRICWERDDENGWITVLDADTGEVITVVRSLFDPALRHLNL